MDEQDVLNEIIAAIERSLKNGVHGNIKRLKPDEENDIKAILTSIKNKNRGVLNCELIIEYILGEFNKLPIYPDEGNNVINKRQDLQILFTYCLMQEVKKVFNIGSHPLKHHCFEFVHWVSYNSFRISACKTGLIKDCFYEVIFDWPTKYGIKVILNCDNPHSFNKITLPVGYKKLKYGISKVARGGYDTIDIHDKTVTGVWVIRQTENRLKEIYGDFNSRLCP